MLRISKGIRDALGIKALVGRDGIDCKWTCEDRFGYKTWKIDLAQEYCLYFKDGWDKMACVKPKVQFDWDSNAQGEGKLYSDSGGDLRTLPDVMDLDWFASEAYPRTLKSALFVWSCAFLTVMLRWLGTAWGWNWVNTPVVLVVATGVASMYALHAVFSAMRWCVVPWLQKVKALSSMCTEFLVFQLCSTGLTKQGEEQETVFVQEMFSYEFRTCWSKLSQMVFEVWGFPVCKCTCRKSVANLALASGLRYTGSLSISYTQQRIYEIIEFKEGYNVKTSKGMEPLPFGWELQALKEFLKLARRHESRFFFIMMCKHALKMNLQISYIVIFRMKQKVERCFVDMEKALALGHTSASDFALKASLDDASSHDSSDDTNKTGNAEFMFERKVRPDSGTDIKTEVWFYMLDMFTDWLQILKLGGVTLSLFVWVLTVQLVCGNISVLTREVECGLAGSAGRAVGAWLQPKHIAQQVPQAAFDPSRLRMQLQVGLQMTKRNRSGQPRGFELLSAFTSSVYHSQELPFSIINRNQSQMMMMMMIHSGLQLISATSACCTKVGLAWVR